MLKLVEARSKSLSEIPEIDINELQELSNEPFASGAYSDVFLFEWNEQRIAVKKLRINPKSDQMKDIKRETSLAISLLHPNIVKVYGNTKLKMGRWEC